MSGSQVTNETPASTPARAGRAALVGWLLGSGAFYLLSALAVIAGFAWLQPTMDQFRLYPFYLELPFPDNVLQRENGHRPIIPGLIRVLEIHLLNANQRLQIVFGVACAVATAGLVTFAALRQTGLGWPARAAGCALALIAVFWLGNARMLLHGNELVHAYLLTLSVVAGAFCVWRARQRAWRWMALASLCGVVATFCFGPGLALFPALAIAAWCAGVTWRAALLPLVIGVACAVLYLFVLPGDEAVRGSLSFSLGEILTMAARWIASPWINAWLGYAEPPLNPHMRDILAGRHWRVLVDSANLMQAITGLGWSIGLAVLIGLLGYLVLGVALLEALRQPGSITRLGLVALVLMLFGAATALLISIARLNYFHSRPDQIFADRYLIWPCLFWLGVALTLLGRSGRGGRWLRGVVVGFAALLPMLLYPTHSLLSGWAAAVHRNNQASAAAVRSDVLDANLLVRDDPSVALDVKLRSFELFRQRGLAMFSTPGAEWLGQRWPVPPQAPAGTRVHVLAAQQVQDLRDGARIEGLVVADAPALPATQVLVVLDPQDTVVGFGEFTFVQGGNLWRALAPKTGFDAYVRNYDPAVSYRLAWVDPQTRVARVLGVFPATEAAAPIP